MLDRHRSVGKAAYYKLDQVGVNCQRGNGHFYVHVTLHRNKFL